MERPFEFTGRIRSFRHALRGVWLTLRTQHNAWVHAIATVIAIAAGAYFGLSRAEWCWIVLACVSVWTAEALNTAFEFLADATTKEFHPVVCRAKDVAAGAVLLTAVGALIIGTLTFWPHLRQLLH